MEPMRLLVTDPALQALRQATAWLIMTLGRKNEIHFKNIYSAHLLGPSIILLFDASYEEGLWHCE